MRVYHKNGATQTILICPAADGADVTKWKDAEGKPMTIPVEFKGGVAEVPSDIGEYMLARGLAQKTRFILVEALAIEAVRRGPILIGGTA